MIDTLDGVDIDSLFTTDGKDVWGVESYFVGPSIKLRNLRTGEERCGGVGCLLLKEFVRLKAVEGVAGKPTRVDVSEGSLYQRPARSDDKPFPIGASANCFELCQGCVHRSAWRCENPKGKPHWESPVPGTSVVVCSEFKAKGVQP